MQSTPQHAARVLGLSLGATVKEVRTVRRKMALKYHPDCSDDQERATRHMARINAAADTLTAYLKKQTSFKPRSTRSYTQTTRARPSPPPEAPQDTPDETASQADAPKADKPQPKPQTHAVSAQRPVGSDKAWRAERALARMATESYTKVLAGIGRADARPTIDVKVLSFATAA